ncbi:hypothetical protein GJ744_006918 [Endocarpon pusillum]|uniref:Regulator of volume decrease after cellular swelling-domain-containing protein n=1 Tax=Endocarpon pusillum TaxID=364733 RepID=A0A8H7E5M5_9EURO|nr:hypothetical protein GJ744_006918 [Endocarpon pusillum]
MEIITEAPEVTSFVPLIEHQSTTPASFYSGPPVLHYHSQRCKLILLESDMSKSAAVQRLAQASEKLNTLNGESANGGDVEAQSLVEEISVQRIISDIDVWVTSEKLLLYSPSSEVGISIPYPTISLHAIQSVPAPSAGEHQGLYMQLLSQSPDAEGGVEDEEEDSISLTIIPQNDAPPPPTTTDPDSTTGDHTPQPPTVAMFTALSNCSNLHPDPVNDEQELGGLQESALFQAGMIAPGNASGDLPPPMPGSGGWITAENMGEYFDEEGNLIGEDPAGENATLGVGAGSVRPREDDEDEAAHENGMTDETKWRRTG